MTRHVLVILLINIQIDGLLRYQALPLEVFNRANVGYLLVSVPNSYFVSLDVILFKYGILEVPVSVPRIRVPLAALEAPKSHFDEEGVED